MKKVICLLCLLGLPLSAQALHQGEGFISLIGVNSYDLWGEEGAYFLVEGFTTAGTCSTKDGLVRVHLKSGEDGTRQLSIVLAAQMANKKIKVSLDDARTVDGTKDCIARWIQLSKQ